MSQTLALGLAGAALVPLLLGGLPIAFSLLAASLLYFVLAGADPSIVGSNMFWFLNKSELVAIPFFILAADLLGRSRATDDLVAAADLAFGRLAGGLALVTMVATIVFSAISGSSVATAIAIGRVMIPKLVEAGYSQRFAVGLVAAGGGLGILVPPSVPLIIYATVAEISVGDVFLAATGPGLMLGLVFCIFIMIFGGRARRRPPRTSRDEPAGRILLRALPVLALPVVILGGIYGGWFTPTEAAAVAVGYSAVFAATLYRNEALSSPVETVAAAGRIAAAVLLIMAATGVVAYIVTENRIPYHVSGWIDASGLTPFQFLLAVNLLLIALGLFLEIISVILITLPIFLPVLAGLGIDPVHFAIIMVINMELAVITPPIGMNLFVISSISGVPIARVFRGTLPFIGLIAAMLLLCTYSEEGVAVESSTAGLSARRGYARETGVNTGRRFWAPPSQRRGERPVDSPRHSIGTCSQSRPCDGHASCSPHTRDSSPSQFSPMTLWILVSGQPARAIAAVRLGSSPMVRTPSGLTTSPNSASCRAYPLSWVIHSKNSGP